MSEYELQIHRDFSNLEDSYRKRARKGTSLEAVLWFLIEHRKDKIWWYSYEFCGKTTSKGHFLSHRSPARASDLAIKHPDLVEDRKIGNLKVYRLKLENSEQIKKFLKITS